MARAAVFVDRDGTVIEDAHYIRDPDLVTLLPGAAEALRALRDAGFAIVIVTNQSGIARGLFAESDYRAVQARVETLLRAAGATIDAAYHCPHHPEFTGPCECRKPGLGLYREAARELDVDLAKSVFVGDRVSDVLPAMAAGGRGFLVRTGYGATEEGVVPDDIAVVDDLRAVAGQVLSGR